MSFTIFLALNSPEFCNTYLRSTQDASPYGMIEVGQYMQLWAGLYLALTLWLLLFKKEQRFVPSAEDDLSISGVYRMIWRVIKLPSTCASPDRARRSCALTSVCALRQTCET